MRDYSDLRSAAQLALLQSIPVSLLPDQLTDLLDELDALRAGAKPPKPKRNDYPSAFEEVWALYPASRQGTKMTAFKAWSARINSGVEPAEILLGLRRYLAHASAARTSEKYLYLAATFFGPDEHFATHWPASPIKGKHGSFGKQDFNTGVGEDGEF